MKLAFDKIAHTISISQHICVFVCTYVLVYISTYVLLEICLFAFFASCRQLDQLEKGKLGAHLQSCDRHKHTYIHSIYICTYACKQVNKREKIPSWKCDR